MKKFSKPRAKGHRPAELDLPHVPDFGPRPPVLTLDQYFEWNMRDAESAPPSDPRDRCTRLFELRR